MRYTRITSDFTKPNGKYYYDYSDDITFSTDRKVINEKQLSNVMKLYPIPTESPIVERFKSDELELYFPEAGVRFSVVYNTELNSAYYNSLVVHHFTEKDSVKIFLFNALRTSFNINVEDIFSEFKIKIKYDMVGDSMIPDPLFKNRAR